MTEQSDVIKKAKKARAAQRDLGVMTDRSKRAALRSIAAALRSHAAELLEANRIDVAAAEQAVQKGTLSRALLKRLVMTEEKIHGMAEGVEALAKLPDPVGRVLRRTELDAGLILEQVTCPIGVIGAVFESRPDAVPQIASLCLKSGNAVLLKGGQEAARSNRALARVIRNATGQDGRVPSGWMDIIETRDEVRQVLALDEYIDLLVPRGTNAFVRYIKAHTRIPVLGHADGICHVYVDRQADPDQAIRIAVDAKTQYPAVCNAAETLLVHQAIAPRFLPQAIEALVQAGVEVRGCARTRRIVRGLKPARAEDWDTEYLDLILSIKVVDSLDAAIAHINRHGSGHTDTIVTRARTRTRRFFEGVDSACVFHNASTRFSDGYRFGLGAELGISTNKTHARGPVGLDGLVIYQYRLHGSGQIVADYSGPKGRKFTHRKLAP